MEWGLPQNLIWLWVLPAAAGIFYLSAWRKKSQMRRFGDIDLVRKLIVSFNPSKRLIKRIFLLLSLLLVVGGLCQPHFRSREITVERRGVDVMIAVDVSRSMLATDIAPNRLEKAKLELSTLIDRLRQDRIGIVAFAGEAFIQCPLTLDRSAVKLFLSTLNPNLIPTPGTALGSAIQVATQAFSEKEKEFKAVILLTDGEDHESGPLQAARRAKQAGVRIFTIGIGTSDGGTLPGESITEGFKRDKQGRVVLSKLDDTLLKQVAVETGGVYYRSSRGEVEVEGLVSEIRKMSQKGLKSEKTIEYEENFQYLLIPALLLLLLELALSERKKIENTLKSLALFACLFFLCGFSFYSTVKNEEGNDFYKKGQVGKAESSYEKALKSEPRSPEIAFNLGNAYYRQESYDKSLEAYKKAAGNDKSALLQSKSYYNLGNNLVRRNDDQKAIDFYKQALRLNPKDQDAKYNLELLTKRQNQPQPDKKDKKQDQKQPQDQKKDQDKNQGGQGQDKKDKQDQGGGQGQEGKQDEKKDEKDQQQGGQGQDKQDKKDQGQDKQDKQEQGQEKDQDQGKDQDKQDKQGQEKQEGEQNKDDQQKSDNQGQDKEGESKDKEDQSKGQSGQEEGKEQKKDQEKKSQQGQEDQNKEQGQQDKEQNGGEGEEGQEQEKEQRLTPGQVRAEQILDALENQEKQVLKMQAGQKNPAARQQRRYIEKDW